MVWFGLVWSEHITSKFWLLGITKTAISYKVNAGQRWQIARIIFAKAVFLFTNLFSCQSLPKHCQINPTHCKLALVTKMSKDKAKQPAPALISVFTISLPGFSQVACPAAATASVAGTALCSRQCRHRQTEQTEPARSRPPDLGRGGLGASRADYCNVM